MTNYYTLSSPCGGFYKEKGSKFIAHAFPVSAEEEVKQKLEELRKKYFDARHHCYAYILGMEEQQWRSNDDGEPNHSAGDPILGQIKSFQLTNTLVVVVRYFGGTKLGVGGLISAYKIAAEDVLRNGGIEQIYEVRKLNFYFGYELLSQVERLIEELDIKVISRNYQEDCRIEGELKKDLVENLNIRTKDLYNLKVELQD